MSADEKSTEEKLRQLGKVVRAGWQKLHPLTDKERVSVREAVRAQWEKEQTKEKEVSKETRRKAEKAEDENKQRQQDERKKKSKGQDHGQSQ